MNLQSDHATSGRVGIRRVIPRWEFRHLRIWASLRIGGSAVLVGCSLLTLGFGGNDAKTYAWALLFLAAALLSLAAGYWELTIAHSTTPRS